MFAIRTFESAYFPIQYKELAIVWILSFLVYCLILKAESEQGGLCFAKKKIIIGVIFSLYFTFVLGGALINRTQGEVVEIKMVPFWSYYEALVKGNFSTGIQILYNIFICVPWGILIPIGFKKGKSRAVVLISAVIFAILLEVLQFAFRCGTCEFDDIFNNALGALLGYIIWKQYSSRRKGKNVVS